jgi:hypothetical protein
LKLLTPPLKQRPEEEAVRDGNDPPPAEPQLPGIGSKENVAVTDLFVVILLKIQSFPEVEVHPPLQLMVESVGIAVITLVAPLGTDSVPVQGFPPQLILLLEIVTGGVPPSVIVNVPTPVPFFVTEIE